MDYPRAAIRTRCWQIAIIVRALYGLKSAGAAFRAHLASFMRQMGYTSCKADPDLWMKEELQPDNNFKYRQFQILLLHLSLR